MLRFFLFKLIGWNLQIKKFRSEIITIMTPEEADMYGNLATLFKAEGKAVSRHSRNDLFLASIEMTAKGWGGGGFTPPQHQGGGYPPP
jgi:hypothetical protein